MKIVHINSTFNLSTGKIALSICNLANKEKGWCSYLFYSFGNSKLPNSYKFTNKFELLINKILSHLFGKYGFYGFFPSRRILKKIKKISPDIVHLHNVHSHDFNFKRLMKGLSRMNVKIFYTFHDCWAFTGYCPYFDFVSCSKWKKMCYECPLKSNYSLLFDKSKKNYVQKKRLLSDLNLTIISPSLWMDSLVDMSFLKNKTRHVIQNGINLNIFRPVQNEIYLDKLQLLNTPYVLAVASIWEKRKGLDELLNISSKLCSKTLMVIVGKIPHYICKNEYKNIIFIDRTDNQNQLACLYSNCVCLVNPTLEENFPTVNLECCACGKPVVTYDTGGSKETISEKTGILVKKYDVNGLINSVNDIIEKKINFKIDDCLIFSRRFDENYTFLRYIDLYKKI